MPSRPAPQANPSHLRPVLEVATRADVARPPEGGQAIFEKEIQEILSFADFEDGWDGHDGTAPKGESIANAISFLRLLTREDAARPVAAPERDGKVGLLWDIPGRNFCLHVSLRPDGTIRWYGDDPRLGEHETLEGVEFRAGTEADLPGKLQDFLRAVPRAA